MGSKRRRTKAEIEEQKLEAMTKQQAIEDKLKTIDHLQQQLAEVQGMQNAENEATRVLQDMMNAGFVQRDSNGVWGPGPNVSQTQAQ